MASTFLLKGRHANIHPPRLYGISRRAVTGSAARILFARNDDIQLAVSADTTSWLLLVAVTRLVWCCV